MMKTSHTLIPIFIAAALILASSNGVCAVPADTLSFGRFGKVFIYKEKPQPAHVVLFVSGDGGWNLGVIDMARTLSSLDALVVGIDITRYLRTLERTAEECLYPASDFELLSKYIQMKYSFPVYRAPVLVGYSSGATLIYATLVQAPPQTFKGGISMGFCPDLPLTRPMCQGSGLEWTAGPKGKGFSFLPSSSLEAPWVVLHGTEDQVCSPAETEQFVRGVKNGSLVLIEKVGHGFAVQRNWMPQFKEAFAGIVRDKEVEPALTRRELNDLPIEEVPSKGTATDLMAVFISGDGGWGVTEKGVTSEFASRGIPTAGLNSLHYFWNPKTPEIAANDITRMLGYYLASWKRERAVLIGYSLGADVLPFIINRLAPDIRSRVELAVFINPSKTADFEFHLEDWLKYKARSTSREVLPELKKMKGMNMIFFYGEDEEDSLCRDLDPSFGEIIPLKGGHRVGGRFAPIVDAILKKVK
jgi:type IV secretory pathway VirJ component